MSQEDTTFRDAFGRHFTPDVAELAKALEAGWQAQLAALRATGTPLMAGDGGDDGGDGDDGQAAGGDDGDDGDGAAGDDRRDSFDRDYVEKLRRENAAARKRAQEAEARVKEFEDKSLSETEKLKKDAEEALARGEAGTQKLRTANLMLALNEKGLTGGRAKAAGKLLDVEYDEHDEPKNLDAALKTAAKSYGDDVFAAGPRRTSFDGGPRDSQAPKGDMDAAIRAAAGRG